MPSRCWTRARSPRSAWRSWPQFVAGRDRAEDSAISPWAQEQVRALVAGGHVEAFLGELPGGLNGARFVRGQGRADHRRQPRHRLRRRRGDRRTRRQGHDHRPGRRRARRGGQGTRRFRGRPRRGRQGRRRRPRPRHRRGDDRRVRPARPLRRQRRREPGVRPDPLRAARRAAQGLRRQHHRRDRVDPPRARSVDGRARRLDRHHVLGHRPRAPAPASGSTASARPR